MKLFLLALLALSSTSATPLGETSPQPNPLCSVVMMYDEIHSDSPHWSASFQIKTREPLEPGSIVDIQLAGNNTSTSPIPTIVGIKINGHNVCPTEKVLTTISTYSSRSTLQDRNNTTVMTTTEAPESETEETVIQTDATTVETLQTNPTTPQSQLET